MPIPKPSDGENERDFISRCMADENMQEYPQEQRAAICYAQVREKSMTTEHAKLVEAIRGRKAAGHVSRFGYGIGTADGIVAKALEEIGDGFCKRIGGAATAFNRDEAIKLASDRLVACVPEAKVEQTATVANFKSILPDGIEPPPHTLMVMRYTLTTARKDRDGDVLHPEGAEVDPAGPMLWQHLFNLPIGKMLTVIEKSAKRMREVGVLLDLNELTEDCAKLFEAGALRFSHGFQAIDWRELKSENFYGKGRTPGKVGFEVLRYEILERSAVSIPSNSDAILELHGRGKLASEVFKKQAQAIWEKRPTRIRGASVAEGGEVETKAVREEVKAAEQVAEPGDEKAKPRMFECPECGGKAVQAKPGVIHCPECGDIETVGDEKAKKPADDKAEENPETVECPKCGAAAKVTGPGKAECPECGEVEIGEKEETPAEEEAERKPKKSGIWVTLEHMRTICPAAADAMESKSLESVNVESLPTPVLEKFLRAKAGRVLSAANVTTLQECLDDLEELAGMQLPRAADALAGRIVQRLGALVAAATPASEEPETEKAEVPPDPIGIMLAQASPAKLKQLRTVVDAMLQVEAIDAAGHEYRKLCSD